MYMSKGPQRHRKKFIRTSTRRREAKAEPSTKQKTAKVQANLVADLEGGGVILRFRKDSCEPLVVKKTREPENKKESDKTWQISYKAMKQRTRSAHSRPRYRTSQRSMVSYSRSSPQTRSGAWPT